MSSVTEQTIEYGGADLYPMQRAAIFDPARISVIEAGVKCGKTIGALAWLTEQAMQGASDASYWWVAPVFAQAEIAFRRLTNRVRNAPGKFAVNKSTMTVVLPNRTRMVFKSGERFEDLYGEDVHAAVLDEASRMREEAWVAVLSTLTKTGGPVRLIGNVRGRKNWFFKVARMAESGSQDMAYHKITCYDAAAAGILRYEEIELKRRELIALGKEWEFNQLYLAEAVDEGDNPFGLAAIRACLIDELSTERPLVAGVDLAGRGAVNVSQVGSADRDWTAIVLLDRKGFTTRIDRFRERHTETEAKLIEALHGVAALVDSTGTGDHMVERLQRRGNLRVEGYTYTERSRQDLLEGLAFAIQESAVHFPDGPVRAELEMFEVQYTRRGERWVVPAGAHDDVAMALALAVKKLPWRRKNPLAPTGVPAVGGSRWTGVGSGDGDAWRRYQDSLKPGTTGIADEDTGRLKIVVPPLIFGPGAGKWTGGG